MAPSLLDDTWPDDDRFSIPGWAEQVVRDEADAHAAESDDVLIASFASSQMLRLARTTQHKYTRCMWEFKEFLTGWNVPSPREAHRRDVLRFLDWLEGKPEASPRFSGVPGENERWPAHKPLSGSSRKGYLSALRAFYRYCLNCEYDLRYHDPTAGIPSPSVTYRQGLTLEKAEIQAFLDAPGKERDRIQAYLLVFTAQRSGALRELRWRDVNWSQQEIVFYGKNDKENVMPIHDELLGALSRWFRVLLDQAETNPLIAAALYNPDTAHVLLTRNGRPVTGQTLAKQAKWRAARCGVRLHEATDVYRENKSAVHPHSFRRSWATIQRRNNVSIEEIADVLSHASTDTTRKHYAFPSSAAKKKTVKSFVLT